MRQVARASAGSSSPLCHMAVRRVSMSNQELAVVEAGQPRFPSLLPRHCALRKDRERPCVRRLHRSRRSRRCTAGYPSDVAVPQRFPCTILIPVNRGEFAEATGETGKEPRIPSPQAAFFGIGSDFADGFYEKTTPIPPSSGGTSRDVASNRA